MMDVVYERSCGLDVHQRTVVACVVLSQPAGAPTKQVRTFATMADDLLALADWLESQEVTHVAMESTGVYWKPVWNLLEDRFTLLLVNAQHVKAVPGRKTDVKDCEWLADLLRHGLLRGSFVPEQPQRELRELTRYRTALPRERTAEVNRLHKTLEGANLKLATVASDVLGVSGRQMLEQLVAGATDPATLASVARGKSRCVAGILRAKLAQLERALAGRVAAHQRFLLARQLAHIDCLDETIAEVSREIGDRLGPLVAELERLDTIPGVGPRTAEVLLAEIGRDLSRFGTAARLASWAGLCPGNQASAGKRKSGKTRKGDPWLRAALIEAAHAASRTKDTALSALYRRLVVRRGKKKAIVAVAHRILVIAYHVLTDATTYQEADHSRRREQDRQRIQHRLVGRLERMGLKVTIEPAA